MATVQEIMANARIKLNEPNPQEPSPRMVLDATLNHCQSLFNQISNSNEPWAIGSQDLVLTVTPGQEEYLLSGGPTMGKPFLMYTMDSSNPAHIERTIDTYTLQNLLLSNFGPRNAQYLFWNFSGTSQHTVLGVAFYEKGGVDGWYARVRPVPQLSAQYRIIFGLGNWVQSAALQSSPVLSEHHAMIETRVALSVLPKCRWSDDKAADAITRKELMTQLIIDNKQFTDDFQYYIRQMSESRITFRTSGLSYY